MNIDWRTTYFDKAFTDLTKDEIKAMRRSGADLCLSDLLEFFKIDVEEYTDIIRAHGFVSTRREREAVRKQIAERTPKKVVMDILSPKEMMAVRMFRGYDRRTFSKMIPMSVMVMEAHEKGRLKSSLYVQNLYMNTLGITNPELKRIRMVLNGEVDGIEQERAIPEMVQNEVRKKYKNQCGKCGDKRKLHFHHIKHFSDGGLHKVDNLILLCVMCHAGEHKDEHVFRMLMSIAEKIEKEEDIAWVN